MVVGTTAEFVFRKQLFFWGIRQPLALCGFWATTSVSVPHKTSRTSLTCFVFKLSRVKYPQHEKNLSIGIIFNSILFYDDKCKQ